MLDHLSTSDHTALSGQRPAMGDLAFYPPAPLTSAESDGDSIELFWQDGRRATFDALWLRDNCPCPACRHPQTLERRFLFLEEAEPRIARAEILGEGHLRLVFAPLHESLFDGGWLAAHRPGHAALPAKTAWQAATLPAPPRVTHAAMMESEGGLATFLDALETWGLALLTEGPRDPGEVERVARRIGPPRSTNFGLVFDVVSKPDPNNSAYTAMGLELHSDLPNWSRPPDIQLLYCLANEAKGGESVFADGFAVAESLRAESPEDFARLAETPVLFRFHDAADDIRHSAPVIETDGRGEVTAVRFNNWIRAALDAPPAAVRPWYGAYRAFWQRLRDPRFRLSVRLEAGQMVAFDNCRVLHGRAAFDPNSGARHLQGSYLDWESLRSRRRLLERRASS